MAHTCDYSEYELVYRADIHPTGLTLWELTNKVTNHILAAGVSRSIDEMTDEIQMMFRAIA